MQSDIRYIPELTGLRGLAVLVVMLYHFMNLPFTPQNSWDYAFHQVALTGWVGVDIFFCLSGYLITTILLNTKQSAHYYSSFYIKRLFRIFPLYYLYLAFVFLVLFPFTFHRVSAAEQSSILVAQQDQPYFWLYLSNIKQFFRHVFFGAALGHMWSLSIEEQFYLIWPMVVYKCSPKALKRILIGVMLISLLIRIVFNLNGVAGLLTYTFTFTRMDALAYGAFVAVLLKEPLAINYTQIKRFFYACMVILIGFFLWQGPWPNSTAGMNTVGFTLIGITTALLILLLQAGAPSAIKRFFSSWFLKFLGKYSYALYIFHPLIRVVCLKVMPAPISVNAGHLLWDVEFIVLCSAISIIVALLSWNLYEKWFLKLKDIYVARMQVNDSKVLQ